MVIIEKEASNILNHIFNWSPPSNHSAILIADLGDSEPLLAGRIFM